MPKKNWKKYQEYNRQWRKDNPEKVKEQNHRARLKRKYGLTPEAWEAMVAAAGGKCQICQREVVLRHDMEGKGLGERAVPDHCHRTGKIRGVLCHTCNKVLGMVGDSLAGLKRFQTYLESTGAVE